MCIRDRTDGDGFFFQFLQAKADTAPYERYGAGMNHLGFGATTPEQVLSIRHAMQSAGFEVPEIQNLGGATALFMKDADGVRSVSYTHLDVYKRQAWFCVLAATRSFWARSLRNCSTAMPPNWRGCLEILALI